MTVKLSRSASGEIEVPGINALMRRLLANREQIGMLTTFSHLARAIESLEEATLHFADAVRSGEFSHHHVWYLDRLDLLRRATANLRNRMKRCAAEDPQQEIRFQ